MKIGESMASQSGGAAGGAAGGESQSSGTYDADVKDDGEKK